VEVSCVGLAGVGNRAISADRELCFADEACRFASQLGSNAVNASIEASEMYFRPSSISMLKERYLKLAGAGSCSSACE